MINRYRTKTGVEYIMDDEAYEKVLLNDGDNNTIYKMERIIEASKYFPSFFVFIVFLIASFWGVTKPNVVEIYLLPATLVGFYMSLWFKMMNVRIIKSILTVFGVLQKFFIPYIVVVLVSIFYLHNYGIVVIYMLIAVITSMFSPSYEKKFSFNKKAAEYVVRDLVQK